MRLPIVHVSGRDYEVQQVTLLVVDQVQFESVEPAHRALPILGESPEYPVAVDVLVPAHPQRGAGHEVDVRTRSHAALPNEQDEGDGHLALQFDESVVGNNVREQVSHILACLVHVKSVSGNCIRTSGTVS